MATLNANTAVVHPETGEAKVLLAGQDVPEWAADLVGDHLLADEKPAKKSKPAESR